MVSALDSGSNRPSSSLGRGIASCSWARHFTPPDSWALGPGTFTLLPPRVHKRWPLAESTDSLKILVVILDERLTFKPYIQEQLKKARAKAASLRNYKLCKFIPQDVMI